MRKKRRVLCEGSAPLLLVVLLLLLPLLRAPSQEMEEEESAREKRRLQRQGQETQCLLSRSPLASEGPRRLVLAFPPTEEEG